ncbi:hypothetical protein NXH76_22710 [Blautia schinkii]|nr:hypothetical protein [Blautia schinkii]
MKKILLSFLTAVCILSLAGFQSDNSGREVSNTELADSTSGERLPEPEFPLSEDVVNDALDELGLDWDISEDEIQQISGDDVEGIIYTFCDPVKTQSEDSTAAFFYGGVSSGLVEGKRQLSLALESGGHGLDGVPFAWEDWKQMIVLGTKLYGGFENEEEVYRALSELEVPDDDSRLKWGVPLSKGYCNVQRGAIQTSPSKGRYALWINFYESEENYQQELQKSKEIQQKRLREMSEGTKKRLMQQMDEDEKKKFLQEIDEANQMEAGD